MNYISPIHTLVKYEVEKHLAGQHDQKKHAHEFGYTGEGATKDEIIRHYHYQPGRVIGGVTGAVINGLIGGASFGSLSGEITGAAGKPLAKKIAENIHTSKYKKELVAAAQAGDRLTVNTLSHMQNSEINNVYRDVSDAKQLATKVGTVAGGILGAVSGYSLGSDLGVLAQKKIEDAIRTEIAKRRFQHR